MPTTKRKGPQTGLLIVAVVLLCVAGFLNFRNLYPSGSPSRIPLPEQELTARPLAERSVGDSLRFTALPSSLTGVEFTHPVDQAHPQSYLYFSGMASGGTAIGDVSGDGRPDLFIASGPRENRLYVLTETSFKFEDVTESAGVGGGDAWGCGATMVDINADGRLDIFVANYDSPNQLFINLGNGKFEDRAASYGLNITDASLEGAFADFDRDGDLDLYLLTYRYENPRGMPALPPILPTVSGPEIRPEMKKYYEVTQDAIGYGVVGRSDGLLRNNGDGSFTNITYDAGIYGHGHGQSAMWFDYNNDGYPDLYVGNDFNDPDRLYRNNGDGTFRDVVHQIVPHTTWFSMGSDTADINGDGYVDLLSADMSSTTHFKQKTTMGSMSQNREFLETTIPRQYMRNALWINTGLERFQEAAYLTGLDSTDWTWAVRFCDLDCDGRQDVFVTNGSVRTFTDSDRTLILSERQGKTEWDLYKDSEVLQERNLAFRNDGDLQFSNVSREWGLDHLGVSMSTAHGDFDGDGDLDLVVANVEEPVTIYRNDSAAHRRVTFRLHGRDNNRFGVGARVAVVIGDGKQIRELQPTRGFLASNQPLAHFGCGDAEAVDVTIDWPTGQRQQLADLATNQHYTIVEPEQTTVRSASDVEHGNSRYEHDTFAAITHKEDVYDDYAVQSLLPHKMSRLGPCLAMADINGDGRDDLFLGGAHGQAGTVALGSEGGGFDVVPQPELDRDQAQEDMAALWIDVDGDQDQDLLVADGGSKVDNPSGLRLYLNGGDGGLRKDSSLVPKDLQINAGAMVAADFDADGDVDLFIGGRQQPGKYPLPGKSVLLRRESDRFVEATNDVCAALADVGMVTGALWTDVDNDDDLDLMVSTEWGNIHLFANDAGALTQRTAEAGLLGYKGWWTGLTGVDVDRDGDMDYVATNLGLNTKYHASDERPFQIYYGDFDGSGTRKLVEAEYENDTLFPVRGKSCSTHAIPSLATKFQTYKAFAAASLQDIYTVRCLEESYQCSANWLASVVLINDGAGKFRLLPLPRMAQISPGFGVVAGEFTGDGIPDLVMAQNFFSPQPETGNYDGGVGCLLVGNGDGTFDAMSPRDSGILMPGDMMAAAATDQDRDGRAELLVSNNDGPLHRLRRGDGETKSGRFLGVRFSEASSSELAGTRIVVENGGDRQLAEVYAGQGYLSQQSPTYFFGASDAAAGWRVTVRRPDGEMKVFEVDGNESTLVVPAQ